MQPPVCGACRRPTCVRVQARREAADAEAAAGGEAETKGDDLEDEVATVGLKPGEESRPNHRDEVHMEACVLTASAPSLALFAVASPTHTCAVPVRACAAALSMLSGASAASSPCWRSRPTYACTTTTSTSCTACERCSCLSCDTPSASALRVARRYAGCHPTRRAVPWHAGCLLTWTLRCDVQSGSLSRPSDMAYRLSVVQDAMLRATAQGMPFAHVIEQVMDEENGVL